MVRGRMKERMKSKLMPINSSTYIHCKLSWKFFQIFKEKLELNIQPYNISVNIFYKLFCDDLREGHCHIIIQLDTPTKRFAERQSSSLALTLHKS